MKKFATTDDLKIAIHNKRAKALVASEQENEEIKVNVVCSNCGASLNMKDECPVCGAEVDWGF